MKILILLAALTLKVNAQNLTLLWNPNPETNIIGYKLYLGSVPGKYYRIYNLQDSHQTNIIIPFQQLIRGATNYFAISAYNQFFESVKSDEYNTYIYNKPMFAPYELKISSNGSSVYTLSWKSKESKNPIANYLIQYRTQFATAWTNLLTNETTSVMILPEQKTNYYRVLSWNELGYSPPSEEIELIK
jgi:hypothetical protein